MNTTQLLKLREEIRDALEVAIAAPAPWPLLEQLGAASGLLEALADVPQNALVVATVERANRALRAWHEWNDDHRPKTVV